MSSSNHNGLGFLIIGSSLITCGLMLPVWAIVGIIYVVVQIVSKPQKPEPKPVMRTILPSNEHASDWEFIIVDIP